MLQDMGEEAAVGFHASHLIAEIHGVEIVAHGTTRHTLRIDTAAELRAHRPRHHVGIRVRQQNQTVALAAQTLQHLKVARRQFFLVA